MPARAFDVILFDFGGVLIKLSGVSTMMEWTDGKLTVDEMFDRWMTSPAVRAFESGKTTADRFAERIIDEFALPVDPESFLETFVSWSSETFPDSIPLLKTLSSSFQLASLSNTNPLHWKNACHHLGLTDLFDFNFPSHETGYLKPNPETFAYVAGRIPCPAERILFFDDHRVNVENARKTGMTARQVSGIDDVVCTLKSLGITV